MQRQVCSDLKQISPAHCELLASRSNLVYLNMTVHRCLDVMYVARPEPFRSAHDLRTPIAGRVRTHSTLHDADIRSAACVCYSGISPVCMAVEVGMSRLNALSVARLPKSPTGSCRGLYFHVHSFRTALSGTKLTIPWPNSVLWERWRLAL